MRVLVAMEYSGTVRDAFLRRGHDAMSCDLLETEVPGPHFKGDIRTLLEHDSDWDLMICHPDCTYLTASGLHWNKRGATVHGRPRAELTEEALDMVRELLSAPIPRIALENPIGRINTAIRKPDQYIQPYDFGHDASKKTGLWLKGLPKLQPTTYVPPRMVNGRPRWGNQTDSGQNKLGPSEDRWKDRSRFYEGWAEAMASQWGRLPTLETAEGLETWNWLHEERAAQ